MLSDFTIIEFDEISSTQDYAIEQIEKGLLKPNTAISALAMTKGRARYVERQWQAPKGNISVTICIKDDPNLQANQACYVAGNAVHKVLKSFFPNESIMLKWVNDVYVRNKKICGILIERINGFLLIGIGLNLVASDGVAKVNGISTEDLGQVLEHKMFLKKLLAGFISEYNSWSTYGFVPVRNYWLQYAYKLAEEIKVNYPNGEFETGVFFDIDAEGKLLLQNNGSIKYIDTGELFNI